VLSIRHKDRKKDEVAMRVRIEDRRTGMIIWREFRTKLNSDGRAEIVVDNLNPNTTYALRADVRKITLNRFSRNSDTVMVTTSGQAVQQQEAQ
ncbi:MAG TPA: hypothetical protein DIT25_02020, partial [Candidatus Moranbacteria bacterium]|nr:hypothetical protein [Candidatus Moranbacteria bacterium]